MPSSKPPRKFEEELLRKLLSIPPMLRQVPEQHSRFRAVAWLIKWKIDDVVSWVQARSLRRTGSSGGNPPLGVEEGRNDPELMSLSTWRLRRFPVSGNFEMGPGSNIVAINPHQHHEREASIVTMDSSSDTELESGITFLGSSPSFGREASVVTIDSSSGPDREVSVVAIDPSPSPDREASVATPGGSVVPQAADSLYWQGCESIPEPLWEIFISRLYKGTSNSKSRNKWGSPNKGKGFTPNARHSRKEQLAIWEKRVDELAQTAKQRNKRVRRRVSQRGRVAKIAKSLEMPNGWKK